MALPFISPTLIGLPRSFEGLTPGQVVQTYVQAGKSELFLMLGNNRVALPENAPLQAGQAVQVQVSRSPQGLQLRVVSENTAAPASGNRAVPTGTEALRTNAAPQGALPSESPGSPRPDALRSGEALPKPAPPTSTSPGLAGQATPSGTTASGPPAPSTPVLQILTDLAAGLASGKVSAMAAAVGEGSPAAARLVPLIPGALATLPRLVQQLVVLWQPQAQNPADDLALLGQLVRDGVRAGVLPDSTAQAALQLLAPISLQSAETAAPQLALQGRVLPWEARLAMLLRGGEAPAMPDIQAVFQEDARTLLQELRNNPTWLQFLRERGELRHFLQSSERVQEKITAAHLQNTRGQEAPYLFLEVPTPQGEGFQHARVHFFEGNDGNGGRRGRPGAMVALDVELSALGKLWITLHFGGESCRCRILAEASEIVGLFSQHVEALQQRLEELHEVNVDVTVGLWDGDHIRETARLMGRFGGLDVAG